MTGVEIIAVEEVAVEFSRNYMEGILFTVLSFLVCGGWMFLLCLFTNNRSDFPKLMIGTLAASVILGMYIGFTKTPAKYETQYTVSVSDEVSMNEFLERYEVIDNDGDYYIVKENK